MSSTATQPDLLGDFVAEAQESLSALPGQLAAYAANPADAAPIHAVFRTVHSIKGCAGFLGLTAVKAFAHSVENTLDEVRKGKLALSEELRRLVVESSDYLDNQLSAAAEGTIAEALDAQGEQLLAQIAAAARQARGAAPPEEQLLAAVRELLEEIGGHGLDEVLPAAARLRAALDGAGGSGAAPSGSAPGSASAPAKPPLPNPQSFAQAQATLCGCDVASAVRSLAALFSSRPQAPAKAEVTRWIAEAREFAGLARAGGVEELAAAFDRAIADAQTIIDSPLDFDATLLSILWETIAQPLGSLCGLGQRGVPGAPAPAASTGAVADSAPAAGGNAPASPAGADTAKARMVRVREEKLDDFLERVAGWFITCEHYKDLHARLLAGENLTALLDEMRQLNAAFAQQSTGLQKGVVALRRVAIGGLLGKIPKMARTLAQQLGKRIEVHISGEDVEIDKVLLDDLDAPLAHLTRNVLDHGIELPEERRARGVSETGNLWLKAEATRTHIKLTIRDDGRGINRDRLRAKAVERGLLSETQAAGLSADEALELIFHPGLSTAAQVSEISGRGVGMDVVRTAVRKHGGEIFVHSAVNEGTTFRIEIPIKNAVVVIDGLVIRHAEQDYVLPFTYVRELAEISAADLKFVQGLSVITIRGAVYDAILLDKILNRSDARPSAQRYTAVLVGYKQQAVCLLVDEVLGHRQAVVNRLPDVLAGNETLAGVAQLGGGRMAIVLSVPEMLKELVTRG